MERGGGIVMDDGWMMDGFHSLLPASSSIIFIYLLNEPYIHIYIYRYIQFC